MVQFGIRRINDGENVAGALRKYFYMGRFKLTKEDTDQRHSKSEFITAHLFVN